MSQLYQMKGSFDGKTWYQLEWFNVDFRQFEEISNVCKSIEELNTKILETFPESKFKYEYLGEVYYKTESNDTKRSCKISKSS